jgi:flagellar biosynthesis GTPase FlhF
MATSQANAGRQHAQTAVQSARNTNVGASDLPDLPEGWTAGKAGDGRTYYMDSINKRTQWEHPGAAQNKDDSSEEEERLARIARQKEEEERKAAISAVLEQEAKELREAQEAAAAVAAVAAAEAKAAREQAAQAAAIEEKRLVEQRRIMALASSDDGGGDALPSGWTAKRAPDGRTYYENHATKSTSWVKPSAAPARGPSQVPLCLSLKSLLLSLP